ncbi:MAG: hypothetical protein M1831_005311 [Alyxoria varia]|nr:MAG: hypothetical protein M1831_005311 [Alyxoria varia]
MKKTMRNNDHSPPPPPPPPPPPYTPYDDSSSNSHNSNKKGTQDSRITEITETHILPHIQSYLPDSSTQETRTTNIALIPSDIAILEPPQTTPESPNHLDFNNDDDDSRERKEQQQGDEWPDPSASLVLKKTPATSAQFAETNSTTNLFATPSDTQQCSTSLEQLDQLATQPGDQSIEGFPSDEFVVFVQYRGAEYDSAFWSTEGVLAVLERGVRYGIAGAAGTVMGKGTGSKTCTDKLEVEVSVKELSVRYVTEMGLFDTRMGRGVVVRVST